MLPVEVISVSNNESVEKSLDRHIQYFDTTCTKVKVWNLAAFSFQVFEFYEVS